MRKYFLILLLLPSFCFAQVKTEVNLGIDPVTGEPGYQNKDTFRTVYYQGPGLYTVGDTVYSASSGVWSLNGTKAYFLGYAGLGTVYPRSRFEVQTNYNTTTPIDSLGIIMSQSNPVTLGLGNASPPFTQEVNGWNSSTSSSQRQRFHIYTSGQNSAQTTPPITYFQSAKDTTNYLTWMTYGSGGNYINLLSTLIGTNASFTTTVKATYGFMGNGNNMLSNKTATVTGSSGQTVIGNNLSSTPYNPSAILSVYSDGFQGMLLPIMTTAQRDSFGFKVASITVTNGGSGYSSPPTVTGVLANGSAPATNGNTGSGLNYLQTTASVSGGAVTTIAIVSNGGYYNGQVRLVFTGGGGTGATATATMARVLTAGLMIYNSTINAVQTWNGSGWTTGSYVSATATLASGTVTVSEPSCLSTSRILVSYNTPSGTQGFLSVPQSSVSSGSFVINSSSGSDNSTVNWIVTN